MRKTWASLIVAQIVLVGIFGALRFQEAYGQAKANSTGGGSSTVSTSAPITGDGSGGSPITCTAAAAGAAGCVTTGAQTLAGVKTFNDTITSGKTGLALTAPSGWLTAQATSIGQPAGSGISGLWLGVAEGSQNFNNYALLQTGGLILNDLNADGQMYMRFDNSTKFTFDDDGYLVTAAAALTTCASGIEGAIMRDSAAGGTTGKRTKLCLCTSDGAGSPAYAWQNLATGTIGNTTTCGTE
jgi:hypothetical protein